MLTKAETDELLRKRQFEKSQEETISCKNTFVTKGLLYYNNKKRESLLESAESLCYSKNAIERLKSFTCENWNSDNVTIDDIKQLQSIEAYVQQNSPRWERSLLFKLGKFINQTDRGDSHDC